MTYKGASCRLQLWDTAGMETYRSLVPAYLRDASCAIFVFDVTGTIVAILDPKSLDGMS